MRWTKPLATMAIYYYRPRATEHAMLTLLLPVSNAGPGGRLCYEGATASSLETAILKGKWEGGGMERERG